VKQFFKDQTQMINNADNKINLLEPSDSDNEDVNDPCNLLDEDEEGNVF